MTAIVPREDESSVPHLSKSLGSKAALEQLTYCSCPARHPLCKPPSINDPQFLMRQHDLEPLTSTEFAHLALPVNHSPLQRNNPIMSSLRLLLIKLPLGVRQLERQERQMCHQLIELIIVFLIFGFLKRTFSPQREAQNVNFDRTRGRRTG